MPFVSIKTREFLLVAAALLLGLALACTSSSANAGGQRAPLQEQVTQWINDERAKVHLSRLMSNSALDKAAEQAADEWGRVRVSVKPAERAAAGLTPLRESAKLDHAAQAHADDMIKRAYFGHQSPEGATIVNRASEAGYAAASLGENIAQGEKTVDEVMIWWMASAGHRQQIVNPALTEVGVGLACAERDGRFNVVWAQAFASPTRGKRAKP